MITHDLDQLLDALLSGSLTREEARKRLATSATADLGDVRLDLDRRRRCGFPEVIYGEGKPVETLVHSLERLLAAGEPALATRISPEAAATLARVFPQGVHNVRGRTFRIPAPNADAEKGLVCVVTAGTTDLPVAEEACETLRWMSVQARLVYDVGVAGPHRLREQLPNIVGADAVVVVAGMEAALPSVVAGYVDCPVIGVPTSVGYGANFGGLAAILSMLNSCAANVVVVNIDAGFKGGYVAGMIARGKSATT